MSHFAINKKKFWKALFGEKGKSYWVGVKCQSIHMQSVRKRRPFVRGWFKSLSARAIISWTMKILNVNSMWFVKKRKNRLFRSAKRKAVISTLLLYRLRPSSIKGCSRQNNWKNFTLIWRTWILLRLWPWSIRVSVPIPSQAGRVHILIVLSCITGKLIQSAVTLTGLMPVKEKPILNIFRKLRKYSRLLMTPVLIQPCSIIRLNSYTWRGAACRMPWWWWFRNLGKTTNSWVRKNVIFTSLTVLWWNHGTVRPPWDSRMVRLSAVCLTVTVYALPVIILPAMTV